jgi:hypothetical protein
VLLQGGQSVATDNSACSSEGCDEEQHCPNLCVAAFDFILKGIFNSNDDRHWNGLAWRRRIVQQLMMQLPRRPCLWPTSLLCAPPGSAEAEAQWRTVKSASFGFFLVNVLPPAQACLCGHVLCTSKLAISLERSHCCLECRLLHACNKAYRLLSIEVCSARHVFVSGGTQPHHY